MAWRIARGGYGAKALTEEEIQTLQASPETAAGHLAHQCAGAPHAISAPAI